jgi:hypothetical protein
MELADFDVLPQKTRRNDGEARTKTGGLTTDAVSEKE